MVNKRIGLLIASSTLVLGLTACNTNQAMDNNNGNDNNRPNVFNTNDNNDPFLNVNNDNDRDMDWRRNERNNNGALEQEGPLTEEYSVNNRDNEFDISGKRYHRNGALNISDANTSLSSKKYPHTRPILIQEAKYQFVRIKPEDLEKYGFRAMPNQPNQQRQVTQAPTGGQKQAAPTVPKQNQKATGNTGNTTTSKTISQTAQQVINLTNEQRRKNGLPDLKADTQLNGVAQRKSDDMQQNNYFSHTSPTYGSPFDMMRDFGVTYKSAGENIAQGQRTPQEVVNSWMNSEGHRKNILSRNFTHIGVGFDQTGYHWTQMFVGK